MTCTLLNISRCLYLSLQAPLKTTVAIQYIKDHKKSACSSLGLVVQTRYFKLVINNQFSPKRWYHPGGNIHISILTASMPVEKFERSHQDGITTAVIQMLMTNWNIWSGQPTQKHCTKHIDNWTVPQCPSWMLLFSCQSWAVQSIRIISNNGPLQQH